MKGKEIEFKLEAVDQDIILELKILTVLEEKIKERERNLELSSLYMKTEQYQEKLPEEFGR